MRIALLGDIALIGQYDLSINPGAKKRIQKLANKLAEFDYVVANLESPLTDLTASWVCKSMHLRTATKNVELLKYLHVDAVSLANNHIYDFGRKGLTESIDNLDRNGIEWFGADSKHLSKEINGEKISFSGFCCYSTNGTGYDDGEGAKGIHTLTYAQVMAQLQKDQANNALSVFSFHWGTEHTNYPMYEHICLFEQLAQRKDVIIHGHHPHIIQGIQKCGDSLAAYSLGNCLFDDCTSINGSFTAKQNANNKKSFILDLEIKNRKIFKSTYYGFKDEEQGIVFFDINKELQRISKPLEKIDNVAVYEAKRKEQFERVFLEKFGKHDWKWVLSRLNYYSIGARIAAIFRKKKYLQEVKKFLGGRCNG